MRRLDFLILQARSISRNEANSDGTVALSDDFFIQAANDAQDRLQGLISGLKIPEKLFLAESIFNLVIGQESYSIPDRMYMNRAIHQVEFSNNGELGNYVVLDKIGYFNRDTNSSEYPVGHSIRGGKLWITPIPASASGTLRITYERALDDLDKRRGSISSFAGTATVPTSITFNTDIDVTSPINITNVDYICIVDADGTRRAFNLPCTSYNSGTRVLTITGFTPTALDPGIANGQYVTFGKYRTTHSQLPDDAESYLVHYMAQAAFHKDSSTDWSTQDKILIDLEETIKRGIVAQTSNIERIPQFNRFDYFM